MDRFVLYTIFFSIFLSTQREVLSGGQEIRGRVFIDEVIKEPRKKSLADTTLQEQRRRYESSYEIRAVKTLK